LIIDKYKELENFARMWIKKKADLVIIVSKGGLGKTHTIKNIANKYKYIYINTHTTPLKTYLELYKNRDLAVWFDDFDEFLKNGIMVSLAKQLAETREIKEIHYHTTDPKAIEIPRFYTKSNLLVTANSFKAKNGNIKALADRGFFLEFKPGKEEILKKMRQIVKEEKINKEILEFLEEYSDYATNFSLRTLIKAKQLYEHNKKNWRNYILRDMKVDKRVIYFKRLEKSNLSVNEQAKRWCRKFDKSRKTYFNFKNKISKNRKL